MALLPNANVQTVPPVQAGATPGNLTQQEWATFMLEQLAAVTGKKVPLTENNIQNVERWMTAEEPANNWFHANNPLNINASGSGFDTFPNLAVAATSTANLIGGHYPTIAAALEQDASPSTFSTVVVKSPWAGSRYGVAAAGAPPQYVVAGRGLDYIATIPLPTLTSAGILAKVLPADAGNVVPASPTPLAPGVPGINVGSGVTDPLSGLTTLLNDLFSGFGIGWKGVLGIILGIMFIGVGLIFLFHKQSSQVAHAAVAAA
jgi:hypothetical protein